MLYLTPTMIPSVNFASDGVSRAKDWVSVDSGTRASHYAPSVPSPFVPYVHLRETKGTKPVLFPTFVGKKVDLSPLACEDAKTDAQII